jgi:hypothetical protein
MITDTPGIAEAEDSNTRDCTLVDRNDFCSYESLIEIGNGAAPVNAHAASQYAGQTPGDCFGIVICTNCTPLHFADSLSDIAYIDGYDWQITR